jgi:hypothetical protein
MPFHCGIARTSGCWPVVIGVPRVVYGSDAPSGGNPPPQQGWAACRMLPLSEEEFRAIANNLAPYLR